MLEERAEETTIEIRGDPVLVDNRARRSARLREPERAQPRSGSKRCAGLSQALEKLATIGCEDHGCQRAAVFITDLLPLSNHEAVAGRWSDLA